MSFVKVPRVFGTLTSEAYQGGALRLRLLATFGGGRIVNGIALRDGELLTSCRSLAASGRQSREWWSKLIKEMIAAGWIEDVPAAEIAARSPGYRLREHGRVLRFLDLADKVADKRADKRADKAGPPPPALRPSLARATGAAGPSDRTSCGCPVVTPLREQSREKKKKKGDDLPELPETPGVDWAAVLPYASETAITTAAGMIASGCTGVGHDRPPLTDHGVGICLAVMATLKASDVRLLDLWLDWQGGRHREHKASTGPRAMVPSAWRLIQVWRLGADGRRWCLDTLPSCKWQAILREYPKVAGRLLLDDEGKGSAAPRDERLAGAWRDWYESVPRASRPQLMPVGDETADLWLRRIVQLADRQPISLRWVALGFYENTGEDGWLTNRRVYILPGFRAFLANYLGFDPGAGP
jgi:hypothetical protein